METELSSKIGYSFKNQSLLITALTHSSYANEVKNKTVQFNERLEFLGDSVLNMLAAEYLYSRFDKLPEGDLTKVRASVVCENSLYEIAKKIELGSYLFLGKGEEQTGGRQRMSILADATEALIAALYLDGGIEAARSFVMPFIEERAAEALKQHYLRDYKTALQEIVQKNKQETIRYELTGESGPDHDKTFSAAVYLNSNAVAFGSGKTKKEAEQSAAKAALELMGEKL
mgnify:CR=1 FL=1